VREPDLGPERAQRRLVRDVAVLAEVGAEERLVDAAKRLVAERRGRLRGGTLWDGGPASVAQTRKGGASGSDAGRSQERVYSRKRSSVRPGSGCGRRRKLRVASRTSSPNSSSTRRRRTAAL